MIWLLFRCCCCCEFSGRRSARLERMKRVREVAEQWLVLQVMISIVEMLIVLKKMFIPILWNRILQMLFCLYKAIQMSIRYLVQDSPELPLVLPLQKFALVQIIFLCKILQVCLSCLLKISCFTLYNYYAFIFYVLIFVSHFCASVGRSSLSLPHDGRQRSSNGYSCNKKVCLVLGFNCFSFIILTVWVSEYQDSLVGEFIGKKARCQDQCFWNFA